MKTPENLWFTGIFMGYKRGILARYGLIHKLLKTILYVYPFSFHYFQCQYNLIKILVITWNYFLIPQFFSASTLSIHMHPDIQIPQIIFANYFRAWSFFPLVSKREKPNRITHWIGGTHSFVHKRLLKLLMELRLQISTNLQLY